MNLKNKLLKRDYLNDFIKLKDFFKYNNINMLSIDEINMLNDVGIDIYLDDLHFQINGDIEYKGQRVAIYLPDGYNYKWHYKACASISMIKNKGEVNRFVATTNIDKFKVRYGNIAISTKLDRCKHCDRMSNDRDILFINDITENAMSIITENIYERPYIDNYPPNWKEIRDRIAEIYNYTCQECGTVLNKKEYRKFIHIHHKDRNTKNNIDENLISLCVLCHSEQKGSGHNLIKGKIEYKEYLNLKEIGII